MTDADRSRLVEVMARAICEAVGENPDAHHYTMHETVLQQWNAWEHAALNVLAAAERAGFKWSLGDG